MTEITWIEKIYTLVRQVPKGKVTTYGTLAEKVGTRTTSRMVGWAMNASHQATPRVPAHRVVNRNGMLTGKHHFSTPTLMQELLEAEGLTIIDDKIVDFKEHFYGFENNQ
jgi:methylated-DNA-protein-cysteine methyltransferase-like protein